MAIDIGARDDAARALTVARGAAITIDVGSHATQLSADESTVRAITFTGTLTAAKTFSLIGTSPIIVSNEAVGGFDLGIQRGSGRVLILQPGEPVECR